MKLIFSGWFIGLLVLLGSEYMWYWLAALPLGLLVAVLCWAVAPS